MNEYLTLRLPADLARALARRAKAEHATKSALVREAVTRYLAPEPSGGEVRGITGRELLARWATMPHLTPEEAEEFAKDLAAARAALPPVRSTWE